MIIPSIDLQNAGNAVQLIGGEEEGAGRRRSHARWPPRYGRVGEIAVIDLDKALG